jgi:hypothetical protein
MITSGNSWTGKNHGFTARCQMNGMRDAEVSFYEIMDLPFQKGLNMKSSRAGITSPINSSATGKSQLPYSRPKRLDAITRRTA